MLKLTIEAGEYLMIGEDIKVVFTGGTSKYARVLVDAPRSLDIVRSSTLEKQGIHLDDKTPVRYKKERELSPEAKAKIYAILKEERKKAKAE